MKTFKTAFLLTALTLLLLFIGEALGGSNGMTIALVFAVLMNGGAYFFSDKIALKSSGAVPISREESPRLYAVMERLAAKANLPMPKLYHDSAGGAERVCHGAQSEPRVGGGDAGADGNHE